MSEMNDGLSNCLNHLGYTDNTSKKAVHISWNIDCLTDGLYVALFSEQLFWCKVRHYSHRGKFSAMVFIR